MSYETSVELLPKTELPVELEQQGVKVIQVPSISTPGASRKIFINLKPEYIEFKQGQRVLPAEFVGIPDQGAVYFNKTYPPGTKFYADGGHQCLTELGGRRTFFLDALMIHPSEFKKSQRITIEGLKRRGRKSDPNKIKVDKNPNAPKGKRGRKPLDPEEKLRREALKIPKIGGTGKRGRPKKDPNELKVKEVIIRPEGYIPKRGRPAKEGGIKSVPYIKTGKPRGRPKKIIIEQ